MYTSTYIISFDALTVFAENEDPYTVVAGNDGNDYIVVVNNGTKVFKMFQHEKEEKIIPEENLIYESKREHNREPVKIENKELNKNNDCDNDLDNDVINNNIKVKPIIHRITLPKKELVKKDIVKKDIVKKEIVKKDIINNLDIDEKNKIHIQIKKKIVVKKEVDKIEKPVPTLSVYHLFIKEFLGNNVDIPWNERMRAANLAWKKSKV